MRKSCIYVSENGGEFTPWLEDTTLTEATFVGQPNSTYAFYSVARDNAGNAEAPPTTPDAVTATGVSSPGIILTQSGNSTDTSEQGLSTDTYTIALKTVPTGAVNVQVAASDGQTQISSDGITFSNTLNLSLTNRTPVTITVRPVEDSNFETSPHTGTITHAIISSADPAYSNTLTPIPNVTVNITDNDIAIVNKLRANFSEVFGQDLVTRLDSQVNYDWGYSTPDPLIGSDYFVAQWSGLIQAPVTGQYTLFTNSDDGVRLYFEDQLVVDDLRERGWEEKSATVQMEAGKYYRIRLQYLENNSGAGARLSWLPPGGSKQIIPEANLFSLNNSASAGSGTGLRGIYYDNRDFTGTTIGRTDSRVAFDWGGGTPDPLLGSDDFSVRWEGLVEAQYTEKYSFHTIADDGVRLWVNNQLVIDDWNLHGYQIKNSGSIDLVAGQKYDIKLEYFEGGGGAGVSMMWSSYNQGFEVVPTSQLFPN